MSSNYSAIDLFCGIGGLSYGLKEAGVNIVAGIDTDQTCEYAYEENIKGKFINKDIAEIDGVFLNKNYWKDNDSIKILVGCAPCQPFSSHSNKNKDKIDKKKWGLLNEFGRLIIETNPSVVSMENVPNLAKKQIFKDFVELLQKNGYHVWHSNVYCPNYGIPQKRRRLVLLASKLGKIVLLPPTHNSSNYRTLQDAIGDLPTLRAGEVDINDPLHRAMNLSETNIKRIKASKPNGTWEDWSEDLKLDCHKRESGNTYKAVYGRMAWDEPSSTITTQFYNYGTGRFGHPTQNRALSIREGAILQTFPSNYKLVKEGEEITLTQLGKQIGNAVPVDLGKVIGESIVNHLDGVKNETIRIHV